MRINLNARPLGLAAIACLAAAVALPARAGAPFAPASPGAGEPVRNWKKLKRFGLDNINAISSSPDGARLAVATGIGIFVRIAESQRIERTLSGQMAPIIPWSPDGLEFASEYQDHTARDVLINVTPSPPGNDTQAWLS